MKKPASFAEKIIAFNASLDFTETLPDNISVMNPFRDDACATPASSAFYRKYYNDTRARFTILGINPGRFGAGITGVPFTDPIRLKDACEIDIPQCPSAREPSSVFVYEIIKYYGGVEAFYGDWYINSVCPLGFTKMNEHGKWLNYNYYDSSSLLKAAKPFIQHTLPEQISCGLRGEVCFCFGKGKNYSFLSKLNKEGHYFDKIIPLEHPRYIVQYKSNEMKNYAEKYAEDFLKTVNAFI